MLVCVCVCVCVCVRVHVRARVSLPPCYGVLGTLSGRAETKALTARLGWTTCFKKAKHL